MESIKFNPKQHREVAGGGFVDKEADENDKRANNLAEIAKELNKANVSPMDLLQQEANQENAERIEHREKFWKYVTDNGDEAKSYFNRYGLHDSLKNDRVCWFAYLDREGEGAILKIGEQLKNDPDFMLALLEKLKEKKIGIYIKKNGYSKFSFVMNADWELANNRDFLLKAAKINPDIIKFASNKLKEDREFILLAVKDGYVPGQSFAENLKNDPYFWGEIAKINRRLLDQIPQKLQTEEAVIKILKTLGDSSNTLSLNTYFPQVEYGKAFMREAVKINPDYFFYADDLREDKELVLELAKINKKVLQYAGVKLRDDSSFILQAIKIDPEIIKFASREIKDSLRNILDPEKK